MEQPEQAHLYPSDNESSDVGSDDTEVNYLPIKDQYGHILETVKDSGDILANEEPAFKFDLLDVNNGGWDFQSLGTHVLEGALDLSAGNLFGVGAHIGGAIGDLVINPVAQAIAGKKAKVDTLAIANLVSLGGVVGKAVNAANPFGALYGESPIHDKMKRKPNAKAIRQMNESVEKANEMAKRQFIADEARVGELTSKMRGYDIQMEDVFPSKRKTPFHTFNDKNAPWNQI